MSVVITLTAIPSRFGELDTALNALMAQDLPDVKVELYIPKRYRRFADYDGHLPKVPRGVELCVVEEDLGPATKVLYAAEKYRDEAVDILFCDDDRIYMPNWARSFAEARAKRPNDAIVASGFHLNGLETPQSANTMLPRAVLAKKPLDWSRNVKKIGLALRYGGFKAIPWDKKPPFLVFSKAGYVAVGEGFGGFMIKPRFLDRSMWDIPAGLWSVDDVWISGHLNRQGIGIWGMSTRPRMMTSHIDLVDALHAAVIDGKGRVEANVACVRYMQQTYGAWGGVAA